MCDITTIELSFLALLWTIAIKLLWVDDVLKTQTDFYISLSLCMFIPVPVLQGEFSGFIAKSIPKRNNYPQAVSIGDQ